MKRVSLAIIFTCCTLMLAAQDGIRVNFVGAKPTISDFVTAFVSAHDDVDEEEAECDESFNAIKQVWNQHRKRLPLQEDETLTVDERNGYVCYDIKRENMLLRWEMCYWNESDGKHKLFAYNVACYEDGKYSPGQYDGLTFYRYNNATKRMTYCDSPGFEAVMGNENGAWISYDLPRTGKNITVTTWLKNGRKQQKILKFNGSKFSF